MKNALKLLLLSTPLLFFSCSPEEITVSNETEMYNDNSLNARPGGNITTAKTWDFNDLNGWVDDSVNNLKGYFLENGSLKMYTNPNTEERTKIHTNSTYTTGTYTWNVYVPTMGVGDQASIGAFLYNNDSHELDFEIGYGKQTVRDGLGASDDDLILYMTSQGYPSTSTPIKIKREQSYKLSIELSLNSRKRYVATWKIDGNPMKSTELNYGNRTKFYIFCSMENLEFMGDHLPSIQNYALFDSVQFTGK